MVQFEVADIILKNSGILQEKKDILKNYLLTFDFIKIHIILFKGLHCCS